MTHADAALIDVRLTAIRYAARDTNLYEFRPVKGGTLPSTDPGSHIDLHLANGMVRQYSLVAAGENPECYIVGIKRDRASRGGSIFIHDQLRVGTTLKIGGPRNHFPLNTGASHSVFVAGGIGITPIWCMIEKMRAKDADWKLFYSSRNRDEAAFLTELTGSGKTEFNFDEENGGKFLDLAAIVAAQPQGTHFYCCGPTPMITAFEKATASLPSEQVHIEYFTATHEAATDGGYVVELKRSGKEFTIPAGKRILDVLLEAGVDVSFSCEEGICGACETVVISGEPDHRDNVLTEAERAASKTMMVCCSGSKSPRLVLDL